MNLKNTVFNVKRMVDRRSNDSFLVSDKKFWPFDVVEEDLPKIKVDYKGENAGVGHS